MKFSVRIISALLLAVLVVTLCAACARNSTLSGVYETYSETGSYVSFEFTQEGSFVCKTFMLDVKVKQESGSYEIEKGKITLTYDDRQDGIVTFPFEEKEGYILINGSEYYKK